MYTATQRRAGGVVFLALLLAAAAGCVRLRGGAAAPAPADPPAEALALYGRGLLHELHAETDPALECYLRALDLDPANEKLYARVAMLQLRRGQPAAALEVLERLAAKHAGSPLPWRWTGRIREAEKKHDEALAAYRKAVALAPADALARSELVSLLARTGGYAEALAAVREGLRRAPKPDDLLRAAGELYVRAKEAKAPESAPAAAMLRELEARGTHTSDFHLLLGGIYQVAKDHDDALRAVRAALAYRPRDADVHARVALALLAAGREDEALAALDRSEGEVDQPLLLLRMRAEVRARRAARLAPDRPQEARAERAKAIDALRKVLAATPEDEALRLHLGDLLVLQGDPRGALAEFERADTGDLEVKRKLALRFLAAGAPERAIASLQQLADAQAANATVHYYLGELYERLGRRAEALASYAKASAAEKPGAAPFLKRATLLADDDATAARAAVEEGLRAMPDDPQLVEMSAILYAHAGEFAQAVVVYERLRDALARGGTNAVPPAFHVHYAAALQNAGRVPDAVAALRQAGEADPASLGLYLEVARGFDRRRGSSGGTRAVLTRLAEGWPGEPAAWQHLGLFESSVDAFPAAVAAFERAAEVAAKTPGRDDRLTAGFHFWFGAACERAGQIERATKLLARCIELDPEHADALNYLAYMWAERGQQLDRALEYVRRALRHRPRSGAYLDTLGWIYHQQGRPDEALVEIERAAARTPDDPTIEDHRGDVLAKLGREAEALARWKRSFVLDPKNEKVAAKLAARHVGLEPLRREAEAWRLEQEAKRKAGGVPAGAGDDGADDDGAAEDGGAAPIPGLDLTPEELRQMNDRHAPAYERPVKP